MPGPLNINAGTSVVKRENRSIDAVENRLVSRGWEKTGSALGGRIRYFENAGFNVTAISGPLGTVIMPSGPIRGLVFGEDAVGIGRQSSIGAGGSDEQQERPGGSTEVQNPDFT